MSYIIDNYAWFTYKGNELKNKLILSVEIWKVIFALISSYINLIAIITDTVFFILKFSAFKILPHHANSLNIINLIDT